MAADGLTKALATVKFKEFRDLIGLSKEDQEASDGDLNDSDMSDDEANDNAGRKWEPRLKMEAQRWML